ncbi:MAG: methyltransferase domain-containing protein [Promethearchaeota archaeon]
MDIEKSLPESLFLTTDVRKWFESLGVNFFKKINVKKGQIILDFGCRVGNYSIPAGKVVGSTGKVYALDKDHQAVDRVLTIARNLGLDNIIPIKTEGELIIALPNQIVDVVLFYDTLHILLMSGLDSFIQFLREIHRVTRPKGMFSLYVKHLKETDYTLEDAMKEIKVFFAYEGQLATNLMHWDHLETGTVYTFRKSA